MFKIRRNLMKSAARLIIGSALVIGLAQGAAQAASQVPPPEQEIAVAQIRILHKTIEVQGLDIFYREVGPKDAPVILLLHGFPTSSQMFVQLMKDLGERYRLIAPDYPGFGNSAMPALDAFDYTFDSLADVVGGFVDALELKSYTLYVMDYGAPVGYRLATKSPEKVSGLIVQNGNAYVEGLLEFWDPFRAYWADRTSENAEPLIGFLNLGATKWQYTHGTRNAEVIDPDNWIVDQYFQDRPGNKDIQLQLFYDYGSNPPLYPAWQEYFRTHQPPTLIVWGKNDFIFPAEGAHPYKRDLENIEFHLLDTGHFALEEDGSVIAAEIADFMARNQE